LIDNSVVANYFGPPVYIGDNIATSKGKIGSEFQRQWLHLRG